MGRKGINRTRGEEISGNKGMRRKKWAGKGLTEQEEKKLGEAKGRERRKGKERY